MAVAVAVAVCSPCDLYFLVYNVYGSELLSSKKKKTSYASYLRLRALELRGTYVVAGREFAIYYPTWSLALLDGWRLASTLSFYIVSNWLHSLCVMIS